MMHPLLHFLSAVLADFTLLTPGQYAHACSPLSGVPVFVSRALEL